jgi:SpoVK/Ycf46/Vps4 family AAA+-type ATPase
MSQVVRSITDSLVAAGIRLLRNAQKVPLYFWVYLAVIGYVYKRMLRDFLGIGTKKCRIIGRVTLPLTKEEELLSSSVVDPGSLTDSFETVGGLDDVKSALTESVLWPYQHPELLESVGVGSALPTGVLLYGPPGTGKTLLARALAKELGCYFIEVSVEKLFSKYVGESEKLAAAVFSLAHKLRDCVIFVDEIDALLSSRGGDGDSSAVYTHAKTIFMTKWDGLTSEADAAVGGASQRRGKVLVLGATNRVDALDDAILRRLSVRLPVPLPDPAARRQILDIQLHSVNAVLVEDGAVHSLLPGEPNGSPLFALRTSESAVSQIAGELRNYTGSDIRELCKAALMISFRGRVAALKHAASQGGSPSAMSLSQQTTPSPSATASLASTANGGGGRRSSIISVSDMRQAMARVKASGVPTMHESSSNGAYEAVERNQLRPTRRDIN